MKSTQLLLLAAVSSLAALVATSAQAATVGQPAPDFTLTDTNGVTHTLSQYRGQTVVLEWINHGCPFVVKHYASGNMQRLQREAAADGVVWLSICSSAPGQQGHMSKAEWNKTNAEKNVAAAAVLIDEPGTVGRLYGAVTTPHMFIIDADGILVYNGAIDSNPSANPRTIEGAENYVASALAAIKAGQPIATPVTRPYGCTVKYAK